MLILRSIGVCHSPVVIPSKINIAYFAIAEAAGVCVIDQLVRNGSKPLVPQFLTCTGATFQSQLIL